MSLQCTGLGRSAWGPAFDGTSIWVANSGSNTVFLRLRRFLRRAWKFRCVSCSWELERRTDRVRGNPAPRRSLRHQFRAPEESFRGIDLTALVRDWIKGKAVNNGIAVVAERGFSVFLAVQFRRPRATVRRKRGISREAGAPFPKKSEFFRYPLVTLGSNYSLRARMPSRDTRCISPS
jgi:hypothetical protein